MMVGRQERGEGEGGGVGFLLIFFFFFVWTTGEGKKPKKKLGFSRIVRHEGGQRHVQWGFFVFTAFASFGSITYAQQYSSSPLEKALAAKCTNAGHFSVQSVLPTHFFQKLLDKFSLFAI